MDWFCWENLQETIDFPMKIMELSCKIFPYKPANPLIYGDTLWQPAPWQTLRAIPFIAALPAD